MAFWSKPAWKKVRGHLIERLERFSDSNRDLEALRGYSNLRPEYRESFEKLFNEINTGERRSEIRDLRTMDNQIKIAFNELYPLFDRLGNLVSRTNFLRTIRGAFKSSTEQEFLSKLQSIESAGILNIKEEEGLLLKLKEDIKRIQDWIYSNLRKYQGMHRGGNKEVKDIITLFEKLEEELRHFLKPLEYSLLSIETIKNTITSYMQDAKLALELYPLKEEAIKILDAKMKFLNADFRILDTLLKLAKSSKREKLKQRIESLAAELSRQEIREQRKVDLSKLYQFAREFREFPAIANILKDKRNQSRFDIQSLAGNLKRISVDVLYQTVKTLQSQLRDDRPNWERIIGLIGNMRKETAALIWVDTKVRGIVGIVFP